MSFIHKKVLRSARSSVLSEASTNKPPSDENAKPLKKVTRSKTPVLREQRVLSKTPIVKSTDSLRAKIAGRKQTVPEEISPELAAKVVRAFILPMFQNETRSHLATTRSAAFGLDRLVGDCETRAELIAASDGTVLSELKLSVQMLSQLNQLQDELTLAQFLTKDAKQQLQSSEREREALQANLMATSSTVEFFKLQYEQSQLQLQSAEIRGLGCEVTDLKRLAKDLKGARTRLSQELHEEKGVSDKLRSQVVALEHSNHLLKMGRDVMSDHLKGLYSAVEGLVKRGGLDDALAGEFRQLRGSMSEFRDFVATLEEQLEGVIGERDQLAADFKAMSAMRQELKSGLDKYSCSSQARITALSTHSKELSAERDKLKEELGKVSKNYRDLLQEHEKFRVKMRSLHKKAGSADHVMCRNCQKFYTEEDNFNWSCRVHLSDFSGEMWWCCGKTHANAPGCKTGKHLQKLDDFEEEAAVSGVRCSVRTMQSCREVGHLPKDCPKDPNIRSAGVVPAELQRIHALTQRRLGRFKSRADFDSVGGSDVFDDDHFSELIEDDKAFVDIEKVKEILAFRTDGHTEESLARSASFKPSLGPSRASVKKPQGSPRIPRLPRLPGACETKDSTSSRRSSRVTQSSDLSADISRRGRVSPLL
jgi:predicted  nucleic acid-binding Zn-ribbon protein